jgi:O-antigen/teichoic acid export membrane protein
VSDPVPVGDGGHVRRVGRGSSLNLAAAAVAAGLGIVLSVVVTNTFSKSDAGLYFAATSLALITATISRLGTPVGLVYWISRLRTHGRAGDIGVVLRSALTPVAGLSVLLGLLLVAGAPLVADWVFAGDPRAVGLMRALGLLLPAVALSDVMMGASRGFGTMRPTALIDRIARPAMQVGGMLAVAVVGSLTLAGAAWALPYVVTTVVVGWWVRSLLRGAQAKAAATDPDADLRRQFWLFTWPRGFTSVVQVALQRLDVVLVSALKSPAEAALYAVATRFLVVGQLTNSALGLAAQPQLAALVSRGERDAANDLYRTTTAWVMVMNGPLYLVVGAFSPLLLSIFSELYVKAWPITVALCVAAFIGNGVGMVDVMLSMAGRTTWNLMNAVLALTVQVGLDLYLIPRYGAFGAAMGWGASILVANLVPLTQLALVDGLHPFGRSSGWALGLVLLAVGVPVVVVVATMGQTWLALTVALVVSGSCYAAGLVLLRRQLRVDALVSALRRSRGPGADPALGSGGDPAP